MIKLIESNYDESETIEGIDYNIDIVSKNEDHKQKLINIAENNSDTINKFIEVASEFGCDFFQLSEVNLEVIIKTYPSKRRLVSLLEKLKKEFNAKGINLDYMGWEFLGVIIDSHTYVMFNKYDDRELVLFLNSKTHPKEISD